MKRITWLAGMACLTSACGGGGGSDVGTAASTGASASGGPVEGLELPDNFSVLSAKDDAGQGSGAGKPAGTASAKPGLAGTLAAGVSSFAKTYSDADTDYSTDTVDAYVYDRSMESLDLINEIVCYMSQTAASAMINQGPYIALVNEQRCRQGENASSGGETGQSSGGQSAEFARWIVESSRADNASDQRVRLWVPDSEDGADFGPQTILVDLVVSEGASDSRPFGSFVMNFKGVADGTPLGMPGVEIETMKGMLATVANAQDAPQFEFVNIGGDALGAGLDAGFGFEEAANVRLGDVEGSSGLALTRRAETWSFDGPYGLEQGAEQDSFAIDYDTTHFLSSRDVNGDSVGDELVCRARDEFDVRVWRYNLYHRDDGEFRGAAVAAGDRVELNAGFPFSYDTSGDGLDDAYGWVGYDGVWTESDTPLEDGQTIHGFDYDSDATVDYTARVAPGRMIRRGANRELLSAFVGDQFQYWGPHPTLDLSGEWVVTVNQSLDLELTSSLEWGESGPVYSDTIDHDGDPQTAEVPVAATFALQDNEVVWLWSESLGGNVVYTHDTSLAAQSREVTFFAEEYVTARDETVFPSGVLERTLYCYEQCLKGGLTQQDVDGATGPQDLYYAYAGQPYTYTLSNVGNKVLLSDDLTGEIVSAAGLDLSSIGNDWGINTGEMLSAPLADPSRPWLVYEEPVSYRWETGPNPWNAMVTVTDVGGNTVEFDRPLELAYVHSVLNDANGSAAYDGKRFLLQYSGAGDLHGFPWVQEQGTDYWYPAVTLADGVVLSDGQSSFVVKAVEKEQSMREVDASACAALDADSAYDDPTLALPSVDAIGTVGFGLSDRPQVDGAPAVIEGEVQSGSS